MDKEVGRDPRQGRQHLARHRDATDRLGQGHRDASSKACSKWHLAVAQEMLWDVSGSPSDFLHGHLTSSII